MRTSRTRLLGSAALRLVFYARLADSFLFDFTQGFCSPGFDRLRSDLAYRFSGIRFC